MPFSINLLAHCCPTAAIAVQSFGFPQRQGEGIFVSCYCTCSGKKWSLLLPMTKYQFLSHKFTQNNLSLTEEAVVPILYGRVQMALFGADSVSNSA